MLGKIIDGTFTLIGMLWNGFWNVCGKLFGLAVLAALSGAIAACIAEFSGLPGGDVRYFAKFGGFIGFLVGGVRLLINEVAVPLVHDQERRQNAERRRKLEIEIAQARAISQRESVSNRLKHLH